MQEVEKARQGPSKLDETALVVAMLTYPSAPQRAEALGVTTQTVREWQKLPQIQAAYKKAREDQLEHTMSALQGASQLAMETLISVMKDPKAPAMAKVVAAKATWDGTFKSYEAWRMKTRLEALEAKYEARVIDGKVK